MHNTYVNECLKARLLPFIKKYHSDGEHVFLPDLASLHSHYGEDALDFLIENGIHHVDKGDNPANSPECRAIETTVKFHHTYHTNMFYRPSQI